MTLRLQTLASLATVASFSSWAAFAEAQMPAPQLQLEVEQRFDGNALLLSSIGWVLPSAGSTAGAALALFEPQFRVIHFLNSDAGVRGRLGGPGGGPGEFAGTKTSAGWVADSLWVFDLDRRRLTVVAPALSFGRDLIIPAMAPKLAPTAAIVDVLAAYPGGDLLVRAAPEAVKPVPRTMTMRERILRVTRDQELVREVAQLPHDEWSVYGIAPPFNPVPLHAVSPDGSRIAIATTAVAGRDAGSYRMSVLRVNGDTIFSRSYPFTPIPIPASVAERSLPSQETLAALYGNVGRMAHGELRLPPVYQPLTRINLATDGSVWLRMRRSADAFHWMLFDASGNPVGTADVEGFVAGTLTSVWAVTRDANGTPGIVRYRVVR